MKYYCLIIISCLMVFTNTLTAQDDLINSYFNLPKYEMPKLSPNGKHIAIIRNQDAKRELLIIDSETMKAKNQILFEGKDKINRFIWANNKRIIINFDSQVLAHERSFNYGELYAIDVENDKGRFIFGYRSLFKNKRKLKAKVSKNEIEKNIAVGYVLNRLKNDQEHVLIGAYPFEIKEKYKDIDDVEQLNSWVYKLNIYSGKLTLITTIDDKSGYFYYEDDVQELWHQSFDTVRNQLILRRFDSEKSRWTTFELKNQRKPSHILSYSKKLKGLLLKGYCGKNTKGLCVFSPETSKLEPLYHHTDYDSRVFYYNKDNIYAVLLDSEYNDIVFLDPENSYSHLVTALKQKFKNTVVEVISKTHDGKRIIIKISEDKEAPKWYLYNQDKNQLKFVADNHQYPHNDLLTYSFDFKSRDAMKISGYLTLPSQASSQNLPAIVLVHGGPFDVRDEWFFDTEIQYLAALGYAVVRINYRGSAGKGIAFEKAGYQHWGDKIQEDILDGIDYLSSQKILDKNRLCIKGGSFGAYSALQASLIKPHLFKCAIAVAGVYDLNLTYKNSDDKVKLFFDKTMGDQPLRQLHSPIHSIEKLNTPLFISHGTKDYIASFEQFEDLEAALKEHKKEYEALELKYESHGYSNTDNLRNYYKQVTNFLKKYNP